MAVRLLIADDSPFWREQLKALLEHDTGWTVFEACDGLEAVKKNDLGLPGCRNLRFLHACARRARCSTRAEAPKTGTSGSDRHSGQDLGLGSRSTPSWGAGGIFQDALYGALQLSKTEARNWRTQRTARGPYVMSREPLPSLVQPTDNVSLRAEFTALQKQQWEALDRATYFGMSACEAQEYDCRARRITELQRALGINLNVPLTSRRGV